MPTQAPPPPELTPAPPPPFEESYHHPVETFEWYTGPWGECSAQCDGGAQKRGLLCLATHKGTPVSASKCGAESPAITQACNVQSCPQAYWQPDAAWSLCSAKCDGGEQARGAQCMVDGAAADPAACAALEPPVLAKACNTAPCIVHAWSIGDWGECSAECGGGTATRDVQCMTSDGKTAPIAECEAALGEAPATASTCNSQACDFCKDQTCSGNGQCSNGACQCTGGYGGTFCDAPPSCSGTIDAAGSCCTSGTLDNNGMCCDGSLDSLGMCCSAPVDACGVCGGPALSIDVSGQCCSTLLDESGLCCSSGFLDECGICDGDGSSCATSVSLQFSAPDDATEDLTALYTPLQEYLADAMGISSERIQITQVVLSAAKKRALLALKAMADFLVLPPKAPATEPSADAAEPAAEPGPAVIDMADIVEKLAASETSGLGIQVEEVLSVAKTGVCGNGVCEVGERCDSADSENCCKADCPFLLQACPTDAFGNECGGHGKCLRASGTCECFTGHAGRACGECGQAAAPQGGFELYIRKDGQCVPERVVDEMKQVTKEPAGEELEKEEPTKEPTTETPASFIQTAPDEEAVEQVIPGTVKPALRPAGEGEEEAEGPPMMIIVGGGSGGAMLLGLVVYLVFRKPRSPVPQGRKKQASERDVERGETGDLAESYGGAASGIACAGCDSPYGNVSEVTTVEIASFCPDDEGSVTGKTYEDPLSDVPRDSEADEMASPSAGAPAADMVFESVEFDV